MLLQFCIYIQFDRSPQIVVVIILSATHSRPGSRPLVNHLSGVQSRLNRSIWIYRSGTMYGIQLLRTWSKVEQKGFHRSVSVVVKSVYIRAIVTNPLIGAVEIHNSERIQHHVIAAKRQRSRSNVLTAKLKAILAIPALEQPARGKLIANQRTMVSMEWLTRGYTPSSDMLTNKSIPITSTGVPAITLTLVARSLPPTTDIDAAAEVQREQQLPQK